MDLLFVYFDHIIVWVFEGCLIVVVLIVWLFALEKEKQHEVEGLGR